MGIRYRKSVNIGPFRVNASKSGLGWSVGGPGGRYTKMANGRTRVTASVPGTGISWVKETKKPKKVIEEPVIEPEDDEEIKDTEEASPFWDFVCWLLKVLFWGTIGLIVILLFIFNETNKKGGIKW